MATLELEGISKAYDGVPAVSDVSFTIPDGEIVGLVGENGAGKSTLLDVICGVTRPDGGRLKLGGEVIGPRSYQEATTLGIFRVFQEQALLPNLSVAENLYLTHERAFSRAGILGRAQVARHAKGVLEDLGLELDVTRPASEFDFSTRQSVEILRCFAVAQLLGVERPIILFDEPTAALARHELEAFFKRLTELRGRLTAIFVSHRLREAIEHCDRLYVLKDGQLTWQAEPSAVDEETLHEAMVGRVRDADYYVEGRQGNGLGEAAMKVDGLGCEPHFRGVTFTLHAGEVVGLGGMRGAGKSEVGEVLAGLRPPASGSLSLRGKELPLSGAPNERIRQGIAYVPQERHRDGVMLDLSVAWNLTLAALPRRFSRGGVLRRRQEMAAVAKTMDELRVRAPSTGSAIRSLSGGNQQKIVLGKWLLGDLRILVMDNPTRGVDAGAKHEIYALIRGLTERGVSIVVITDDLLELIGLSDRILIFNDGDVVQTLDASPSDKPTEQALVQQMV